ncbi:MAG: hypothetical protein Q4P13_05825 [Psychrobacter sp.]|nr:hypothetical protein [Psychrobacter sp.]
MPQNFAAAKTTVALIAGSSASMVGAATSAIGISEQLNKQHDFLYLTLPIWVFFIGVFVLSAIGAIIAFFTDTLNSDTARTPGSAKRRFGNLLIGFLSGIIGAFVILPSFTSNPPLPMLWITALVMSFSGSVLIHNASELKRDDELQVAVRKLIKRWLISVFEKIELLIGGKK